MRLTPKGQGKGKGRGMKGIQGIGSVTIGRGVTVETSDVTTVPTFIGRPRRSFGVRHGNPTTIIALAPTTALEATRPRLGRRITALQGFKTRGFRFQK